MGVVMRMIGSPHGPTGFEGQYLQDFDFEAHSGLGEILMTPDVAKAKRFRDLLEAVRYRNTVPMSRPYRPDGKLNRPLSATHWDIHDPDKVKTEPAHSNEGKAK